MTASLFLGMISSQPVAKETGIKYTFHQTGRHLLPRMKIYEEVLPIAVPTGVRVGMGKHQAGHLGSRWEIKLAGKRIQHV